MIEKIDVESIRGKFQEFKLKEISAGDDTIKSIKIVADKLNEVIGQLNEIKNN